MPRSLKFQSIFSISFAFVAAAFAVGLSATSASAQFGDRKDRYCEEYAERAVKAAETNLRDRCGFQGPRWITDFNAHRAFCGFVPSEVTRREADDRDREVRACEERTSGSGYGGGGNRDEAKRAACETYARIAVVQAQANRDYRCDFRGPQWIADRDPHFNWCRYVRRSTLVEELRNRAQSLQQCFNKLGDFDDDRYERR